MNRFQANTKFDWNKLARLGYVVKLERLPLIRAYRWSAYTPQGRIITTTRTRGMAVKHCGHHFERVTTDATPA